MQQEHAGSACLASGSLYLLLLLYHIHNPLGITFIAKIEYILYVYYIPRYNGMYPSSIRRVYGYSQL